MTRHVTAVITARPSYSRIKTALLAMRARSDLELSVVVAASALLERYGNVAEVLRRDGFELAASVYMVLEGENPAAMAKTTGLGLIELTTVLERLAPHAVLTVADRYETLATAVAGAYLSIPVVHVQGGEVTGSIDEKVRHAVTKLADLHLVATEKARERVIKMGEDPEAVHVTGCPSIDIAAEVAGEANEPFDPFERYPGVGQPFDVSRPYLVVLQHPVTTEHVEAVRQTEQTLAAVAATGLPALWFWPNPDAGSGGVAHAIRRFRELQDDEQFYFLKNMAPADFLRLIRRAACLVGNSSVGLRESSYLGVPTVNIGTRQQGRERGVNVLDAPYDAAAIRSAVQTQIAHGRYPASTLYGDGHAGPRIAEAIAQAELRADKRLAY